MKGGKQKKHVPTSQIHRPSSHNAEVNSRLWLILPAVFTAFVAIGVFISEKWFLGPHVNVPLDLPSVLEGSWRNESVYRDRLWGTYRSNVYFGIRPRLPRSVIAGVMWMTYDGGFNVRHTCEHGDGLQSFGWLKHDGVSFGQQDIVDNALHLKTEFLSSADRNLGDSWTARVSGRSRGSRPSLVSLVLYVYNEGDGAMDLLATTRNTVEEIFGHSTQLKEFRVYFPLMNVSKDAVFNYLATRRDSVHDLVTFVKGVVKTGNPHKSWPTIAQLPGDYTPPGSGDKGNVNLIAYQITTTTPFDVDMVFEAGMFSSTLSISRDKFTTVINEREMAFDARFEKTFGLVAKGFSESEISFAKAAFSNLIGGISYFYGQSKVISNSMKQPVDYWPAPLYTAVPSRSFFPRGFLWDEGFHQLLVAHWDVSIVKDVIAHWLDLMNIEGWIPREMILGKEALSKVPSEYVVQHSENANPPTFFLTLESLLHIMHKKDSMDLDFLRSIYPRLRVWYNWFNTTQAGKLSLTYRWKGRNSTTDKELNPKTLTSGLDDYPRASHPSEDEYHVDLRCWMALASDVMEKISTLVGATADSLTYRATHKSLVDQTILDKLHWDPKRKTYSDYGLHTSHVKLVKVVPPEPNRPPYKIRKVTEEPTLRFVNSFGYVNLFPFLLKIVSPNSEKLGFILERLKNESYLWTDYGLRSLSRTDPMYSKLNLG
ncbi:hypothetical protein EMCRGX_G030249 [Ephydatia muelleri]